MRGTTLVLAVVTGFYGGAALAQTAAPAATPPAATPPATTPSPAAPPAPTPPPAVIDPMTGMALPLHPWEKVIKFADGRCGAITSSADTVPLSSSWRGACRFGLAHGDGFGVGSNGKYIHQRLVYGLIAGFTRSNKANWDSTYFDDRTYSPIHRRVIVQTGKYFDPSATSMYLSSSVRIDIQDSLAEARSIFIGPRIFNCPFRGFEDAPGIAVDSAEGKAAAKLCRGDPYKRDGGRLIMIEHATYDVHDFYDWKVRSVSQEGVLCTKDKTGANDCTAAATAAVAPYLDEINAVIAADKTSAARAEAEVIARFRPLEAARRAKLAELTRVYAAERAADAARKREAPAAAAPVKGPKRTPTPQGARRRHPANR